MKILKIIGLILVCILIIPFIVALFIPNTYTVSVSETINRPRQEVFDYMRILNNQKEYSVWVMADPNLKPEITGIDGTVGAIQKWKSDIEEVGEGEQEITHLSIDKMAVDLRFKKPFEGNAKAANLFTEVNDTQTVITTEFYSESKYPFNLMSYCMGRKIITEAQTENLQNIKRILEKK